MTSMPTERLYYEDCYLREFTATVVAVDADGAVELDRSAFYPESGGQAHDLGMLSGRRLERVVEQDDRVLHYFAKASGPGETSMVFTEGETVQGEIDWRRRFDLMQHHTGQHLLSAVAEELYGWKTESVHIGAESATIELAVGEIGPGALVPLEQEANRRIQSNLPVNISIYASAENLKLRKPTGRQGPVRVVAIANLDHSACGGTHVRATGEIGLLIVDRLEKIRKNTRLEFACGMRAMRLTRIRSTWLNDAAAVFQSSPDRIATLAAAQRDELAVLSKRLRVLESQEAKRDGADARLALGAMHHAVFCAVRRVPAAIGEVERAFAQGFCDLAVVSPNRSILLTLSPATGAFLLCASPDAGFDAKVWLSEAGAPLGAKGGGTAAMASGRVTNPEALPAFLAALPSPAVELAGKALV